MNWNKNGINFYEFKYILVVAMALRHRHHHRLPQFGLRQAIDRREWRLEQMMPLGKCHRPMSVACSLITNFKLLKMKKKCSL
jgi:hypothetical protein